MRLGSLLCAVLVLASCGERAPDRPLLASAQDGPPETYLASIGGIALGEGDRLSRFRLKTWGVDYLSVCRLPADWEITAGRSGQLGRLEGQAGHGSTQIMADGLSKLEGLALIALPAEIREREVRDHPATFAGVATVERWDGDGYRSSEVPLTIANVRLARAASCPPR